MSYFNMSYFKLLFLDKLDKIANTVIVYGVTDRRHHRMICVTGDGKSENKSDFT